MKHFSRLRLPVILLVVIATITIGIGVWATRKRESSDLPRIENKTRSLKVESVAEADKMQADPQLKVRRFTVTVRNEYDKAVVAYSFRQFDSSVRKGDRHGTETNGVTIGWALLPNETDVTRFFAPPEGDVLLVLSAVLLQDGTGDGDPEDLARLTNYRVGVKRQFQQLVPLLRQAIKEDSVAGRDRNFKSLKDKVAELPDEKTLVPGLGAGLAEGKQVVINELQELEIKCRSNQDTQCHDELFRLLARIEEALAQL